MAHRFSKMASVTHRHNCVGKYLSFFPFNLSHLSWRQMTLGRTHFYFRVKKSYQHCPKVKVAAGINLDFTDLFKRLLRKLCNEVGKRSKCCGNISQYIRTSCGNISQYTRISCGNISQYIIITCGNISQYIIISCGNISQYITISFRNISSTMISETKTLLKGLKQLSDT